MISRLSLRYRIALVILLLEAAMLTTVLAVTLGQARRTASEFDAAGQRAMLELLETLSVPALLNREFTDYQLYLEDAQKQPSLDRIVLADRDGRVVSGSQVTDLGRPLAEVAPVGDPGWQFKRVDSAAGPLGTLAVQFSSAALTAAYDKTRDTALTIALLGMIAIAFVGLVSGIALTRRLERVTRAVRSFAAGEHEVRSRVPGRDEVAELSRTFDAMVDSVASQRRQLVEQGRYVEQLLDSTAEAIYGVDLGGTCTFANRAALRMLGYERQEDLVGQPIHERIHPTSADGSPCDREHCRLRLAVGQGALTHADDEVHWRADGSSFPVEYWSHPLHRDGQLIGAVVAFVDIADRKARETALRIKDSAIDGSLSAIVFADLGGVVTYANPASLRMWGCAGASEVLGRHVTEFWVDPEHATPRLRAALRRSSAWSGELTARRRDGSRFEAKASAITIRNERGRVVQLMGSFVDVTESRRARDALQRLNEELEDRVEARTAEMKQAKSEAERATRAKSEFLATMSHEIRTPMNAILGLTYLALQTELDDRQRSYLDKVHAAGDHLLGIVNGILDFSKVEAGKIQLERAPFVLAHVLERVMDTAGIKAQAKGLALSLEVDPQTPVEVVGDALRLGQVLLNLCDNAIKFTERGRVVIQVECMLQLGREVELLFSVGDTGSGIPEDKQKEIFEPFAQADDTVARIHGGSGLGLAIARQLVELMGGHLGIDSRIGMGSTLHFIARFGAVVAAAPKARPTRPAELAEDPMGIGALRGAKVLLAEDNEVNQTVAAEMLKAAGVEVLIAVNGQQGVDLLRAHPEIELVLMDCQMPVMDGFAATRAIRADPRHAALPVLAISANVFPDDLRHCRAAGMNDHIGKPFTAADLYGALLRWMRPRPEPARAPGAPLRAGA